MNMKSVNTRDRLLALCHLVKERETTRVYRKACEIMSEIAECSFCYLFLIDNTRSKYILQMGTELSNAHFVTPQLEVPLALEKHGKVCPLSNATVLGKCIQINADYSGYEVTAVESLLPIRSQAFGFLPFMRVNGEALGVFLLNSSQIKEFDTRISNKLILEAVSARIEEAMEAKFRTEENVQLSQRLSQVYKDREALRSKLKSRPSRFIGNSASVIKLRNRITQLSEMDKPVLLLGQQGTMRASAAREIHENSLRSSGRFVAIDAEFFMDDSAIQLLCGAKRGALKGVASSTKGALREATGGTLLIENIEQLSPLAQKVILKFLETGTVQPIGSERPVVADTRLIFSAGKDFLKIEIKQGFYQSLAHILTTYPCHLPSMDERLDDFDELVDQIVDDYCREHKANIRFDVSALVQLKSRQYRGNFRELRALIEKICANAGRDLLVSSRNLEQLIDNNQDLINKASGLQDAVSNFESGLIKKALEQNGGSRKMAAELLNIPKRTLAEKCKKYHL